MIDLETLLRLANGELTDDEIIAVQTEVYQAARDLPTVPPHVPATIEVAFIGEAPGEEECKAGRPFVGRAGDELRRWCDEAGVDFSRAYLDNVYPYPAPSGGVEKLSKRLQADAKQACIARLVEYVDESAIMVPLGNAALDVFMGAMGGQGITRHRGSIYRAGDRTIVPMLNPAAVLRNQGWRRRCIWDMRRVRQLLDGVDLAPPEMQHHLVPLKSLPVDAAPSIERLHRMANSPNTILAIDIETAAQDDCISCIGFSADLDESITFRWPPDTDESACAQWRRTMVAALCASPAQKVLHNGLYDAWWLKRYADIEISNWQWDTLCMAHAWYPADNLSLEYLTSILTTIPYYKDEGKDYFKKLPTIDEDWDRLMTYCGRDAIATRMCQDVLFDKLVESNRLTFYARHYPPKFQPMLDMMLRGVRFDPKRKTLREDFLSEARLARDALADHNSGEPLFTLTTQRDEHVYRALLANPRWRELRVEKPGKPGRFYPVDEVMTSIERIGEKTVSNTKLQALLYDKMGLPVQYKRRPDGGETPTVEDLTLRRLWLDYRDTHPDVDAVIRLVQQHRRAHKLAEFCGDNTVDADGRFRFSLKFTPETGRFASSKAPNGRGRNSQNLPRDKPGRASIRGLALPELDHVLLKMDFSQIESRFCFVYTGDPELIKLAQSRPGDFDQHKENAVICRLAPHIDAVTDAQRQIAKHAVHGAQRNMQAETLQDTLIKMVEIDDIVRVPSIDECHQMLEAYHRKYPAIRRGFFANIAHIFKRDRWLENSWGRRWGLEYEDIDDEALRRAFSFMLQSEAAELINEQGFIPLSNWLKRYSMQSRIMFHNHDELVFSCPPDEVYTVMRRARSLLETPHYVAGVQLSVPVEFGLGSSWAVAHEWKELPDAAVVQDAVRQILSAA